MGFFYLLHWSHLCSSNWSSHCYSCFQFLHKKKKQNKILCKVIVPPSFKDVAFFRIASFSRYIYFDGEFLKQKVDDLWITLDRYHIIILTFVTSQYKTFNVSWEKPTTPATACGNWVCWWNDHENVVMSPYDPHHTNCTPFFDVSVIQNYSVIIYRKKYDITKKTHETLRRNIFY